MELNSTEKEKMWNLGLLFWKLHGTLSKPGQLKIDEKFTLSEGKLFVADCSRQLGKSTWSAAKCIEKAIQKPGSRIRCATAFLTDLEQFILPAFDFVLEDCPSNIRPVWKAQKSQFEFSNGSKIRLVGLDRKPNGLRGNRLDLVVLDEAGYISRLSYIYRSVLIPATTHVPDAKIIMLSTQPESPDHDFTKFCDRAEAHGAYVKATIYDNPLLTSQQIKDIAEECGGFNSTAFRREYLCERIVEEERAIIPEFDQKRHVKVSPICKAWKFWNRMASLDSGVRDQTACLFGYYDFARAKLVIEHEFSITGHEVTTPRIAELVKNVETEFPEYQRTYLKVADNDNLILIQDLGTGYNQHFMPTNKDSLHAMVNKVRIWMSGERIEIHPRCVKLIGALKAGIWNNIRKEFDRSETHGHFDMIAALVYFVRNIPEHHNPVPPYFDTVMSDVIFRNEPKPNTNSHVLKRAFNVKGN